MKKIKKMIFGMAVSCALFSTAAFNSFAATVDLPEAFDDLSPIIEFVLSLVEYLSDFFSLFA